MIRKSVEARDWLHTIEPRNVRSVMKRLVEDVTLMDKQVGLLFEEGNKKTEGSGDYRSRDYHVIRHLSETSRTFTYSITKGGHGGYPYSSSR